MRGAVVAAALAAALVLAPAAQAAPAHPPPHSHRYIVVLTGKLPATPTKRSERKARAAEERVAASVGARPEYDYVADVEGFAATLTRSQVRRLRHHPRVKYVERDERVHEDTTQTGAPWHLDRIDERDLNLDGRYTYSSQGSGVTVYVIDTGILANHTDFGGRATNSFDSVGDAHGGTDCNGHGTHVAGIAGGTTYGVAKLATLVGVRVLNCQGSGTISGVIAGVDWVMMHHAARSVANMSLGGGSAPALDTAVDHLVQSGVFVAVAAGNSNTSACTASPARAPAAFTTAASDTSDRRAAFSNSGSCVDAYAPGVQVTSDWIGSTSAIRTISGTSMAAPVVAGIAAMYLASNPTARPADITQWLTTNATTGVITGNPANTANRLVFMGGL